MIMNMGQGDITSYYALEPGKRFSNNAKMGKLEMKGECNTMLNVLL